MGGTMSQQSTKTKTRTKQLPGVRSSIRARDCPRSQPIGPTMQRQWGEGTVVVPAPREVDAIMKSVPEGKLITIQEIRAMVAERHGATIGCPLTVGIFAWIAAHAAEEDVQQAPEECDALLANAQIGRVPQREVSRRRDRPREPSSKPRATRSSSEARNSAVAEYEKALVDPDEDDE